MDKKVKKSKIVKCTGCGDNMLYSIAKHGLLCRSCGNVIPVADEKNEPKRPLDAEVLKQGKAVRNGKGNDTVFKCINCGADIALNDFEIAKKCPYCSSSNVTEFDEDDTLLPNKIIKFEIDKSQINETLKKSLKKKWFLPNMFKANPKPKEVQALYFPTFTFDADAVSAYSGELYKYKEDSEGKSYKENFLVSGSISTKHRDVVIESSSRISQTKLDYVLPYNYSSKLDFKKEYLLGFAVERFSDDLSVSSANAKNAMQKDIKNKIIKKHEADGENSLIIKTTYSNELFDYCIMPIYVIDFEYKNKPYTAYMNGQTGKTGGKLPKSWIKITFAWLAVLAIIALIIVLASLGGE